VDRSVVQVKQVPRHLLRSGRGAEHCAVLCVCVCVSVSLSASISLEPLDRSSQTLVCGFLATVAQSPSGSVAIYYVLPVLWMTLRLAVVGRMAMRGRLNL